MFRIRAAVPVVLGLLASSVVGLATPAAAVSVTQPNIVNAVPATNTPDFNNGIVYTINQVGNTVYAGGSFTSVSPHGSSTTFNDNYIAAFNASTGALQQSFAPSLNGAVESIAPGPAANQVYVAGDFGTVNGVNMHVALLNTSDGSLVSTWKPSSMNGKVQQVVLANGMLFVGGSFTSVGGAPHGALVALNPTTGKVLDYVNLSFTGHHNYGVNCTAGGSNCASGTIGIKSMDIDPSGQHLVAIGNFNSVSGNPRDQLALIDLGATSATVDSNFNSLAYSAQCFSGAFDSYVRGVEFSPDGSYFVVVATGGSGTNKDGTNSSCDTAARFETTATGDNVRPTWIDYTGQDTLLSVAITGGVVYVGGHQRWLNNSHGFDQAGPGAVPRPGIAALDPINGVPFSWNPGRNPRGAGAYALYASDTGLYVGSDTDYIGNFKYLHKKLAFFPLAGGEALPDQSTPQLPGRVYTAGGFSNTSNSNVLYRVDAGGPTIGATDNGPDWQGDQSDPSTYRNNGSNASGWDPVSHVDNTVPSSTPSAIFDSERWDPGSKNDGGEMHWEFPVPAGEQVDVRLYFANRCTCTSGQGQRVFDVAIDGQSFLNNFDIVKAAGDQTGTMRHQTVTSDGQVTIDFTHEVENPLIDGIEIVKTTAPTTFPATMYRLNAGGSTIGHESGNPADWLGDTADTTGTGTAFRSGGNIESYDIPWGGSVDGSVPAATPKDMFSTGRWAPSTWTFPVAPGTPVNVKLFFANNCTCTQSPGQRVFNVAIDGNPVLTNYDIVADVGDRTGVMKKFDVTSPASGQVTVTLTNGSADNAVINGIQVDQTGATVAPPASDPDRFSYRHFDGTTVGAEQTMSTGISWGSIRGAFMVNGELIYGKADGNLYERTFDGTSFGAEQKLDPYHDPNWDGVDTGSGNTYDGQLSTMSSEMGSVTSMFFTNGRLYYTLSGNATMHWRWFEPESGIIGSDEFSVSDGDNWSNVAGAFLSGNTLYYANRNNGSLSSIGWNGTQATGSPTVVDTTQSWASRGIFLLADAQVPNQPPVAAFTSSCSSTDNTCSFDASGSHDPDGTISDYSWTFGDGSGQHNPDATIFSHDFGQAGHYTVTLTVKDNDGVTDSVSHDVTVGASVPTPTFGGVTSACGSGSGKCGTDNTTLVGVPSQTAVGDALLMFVTWPTATTTSATVPSGWQLLGKDVSSPLESDVYYRAAKASDVGGTVQVNFSAATKNNVTLADYKGADPTTIEAFAKASDANTATHVTPTVNVTQPGSLALSYWADKSSSTTAWTLPGSVTSRSQSFDTGGGYVTSVLADSGSPVGTGSYGGLTATTNAASGKGAEWTIVLQPAGGTPTNAPPTADFTSTCTDMTCAFDASGSHDSDGTIASYAWDYGDGTNGTGVQPSHTYTANGTYHVKLTVTDNGGATDQVTKDVVVPNGSTSQDIQFVGADTYDNNRTSGTVTIPAAVSPGDTLLLFESHASTTATATAPAGWTQVGTTSFSNLTSTVYERAAVAGDAGSTVTVAFSTTLKAQITVVAYRNASATPIEVAQSDTARSTTDHTAPALSGLTAGTWVVSLFTDKATGTTAWTPPGGETKRADIYGTGGGAISALVADSGGAVSGSSDPAQTATTNATSGSAAQWSIALQPAT